MSRRRSPGRATAACAGTLDLFPELTGVGPAAAALPEVPEPLPEKQAPPADERDALVRAAAEIAIAESQELLSRFPSDDGPLSDPATAAIRAASIVGTRVELREALPRPVYEEVADAFHRIGGRWIAAGKQRRDGMPAGHHRFPAESVDLVRAVAESGRLPPRNPTAFFPSPPEVVDAIVELAELGAAQMSAYRLLEPHAGQAAIADRMRSLCPGCSLDTIEVLDLNVRVLRRKGYNPIRADFLRFNPGPIYDRILANPPFSLPGSSRAYEQHIRHAWELLSEYGVLVSVMPATLGRPKAEDREFERWIADRGEFEELPSGSFRASGTGVATGLVCLDKRSAGWKRQPFNGWGSWHAWHTALWAYDNMQEQERRLFNEIGQGRFGPVPDRNAPSWPLASAITAMFRQAADELNRPPYYAGVNPSDKDFAELTANFLDRYPEYQAYTAPQAGIGLRSAA